MRISSEPTEDPKGLPALSRYENHPEECRKLSQNITDGKKFILGFGQNKDGELGLSHYREGQKEPRPLNLADDMNAAQSISSGSHHSALVTKSGELYVCGSSLHGKLGLPELSSSTNINKFARIPLKSTIRQVACGDYHTLALSKEGWVYTWGGSLHKKASGGSEPTIVQTLVEK